jgi:HEAT repeat protein
MNLRKLGYGLVLAVMLAAVGCTLEKTEQDWADELGELKTRDAAMRYIQNNAKNKKLAQAAIPKLIEIVETDKAAARNAVKVIGMLGDPVAVPKLIEIVNKIKDKDSPDFDRLTNDICQALGLIGDKNAIPTLADVATNKLTGNLSKAGAVQALGLINDPKSVPTLLDVMKNVKLPMIIRHYAVISLGKLRAAETIDDLAWALFVDKEGYTLFRDAELAIIRIGGEPMCNAMKKLFTLQNEKVFKKVDGKVLGIASEIGLEDPWVQIKAVEVMGQSRDKCFVDFLLGEFDKAIKPNSDYAIEVMAKMVQAIGRLGDQTAVEPLLKIFISKPMNTEQISIKEHIANALIQIGIPEGRLEELIKIFEAGDTTIKGPDNKPLTLSQIPVAAANALTQLDLNAKFADRFDQAVAKGKVKTQIFGLEMSTPDLLKSFQRRYEISKRCKSDAACYAKEISLPPPNDDGTHWAKVEKSLMAIGHLGDVKVGDAIVKAFQYPNLYVLNAAVFASNRLCTKDLYFKLMTAKKEANLGFMFQKPFEELGYVLAVKKRQFNITEDRVIDEEKMEKAGK